MKSDGDGEMMRLSVGNGEMMRLSVGKKLKIEVPDLLYYQKESYKNFLQQDIKNVGERKPFGIWAVLRNFVIDIETKGRRFEIVDYEIEPSRYTPEECKARELTYGGTMKVLCRLILYDMEGKEKKEKEVREEWVYFGEIPLMTERGTFILDGVERVVISQIHKSPGAYFEYDKAKLKQQSKYVPVARIVPIRGMWIDLEFDAKDVLFVRLQRKKRFNSWIFFKALGLELEDLLLNTRCEEIIFDDEKILKEVTDIIKFQKASKDYKVDNLYQKEGTQMREIFIDRAKEKGADFIHFRDGKWFIEIDEKELTEDGFGTRVLAEDIEGIGVAGDRITKEMLKKLKEIKGVKTFWYDDLHISGSYIKTYQEMKRKFKIDTAEEAAIEFFRRTKIGEPTQPKEVLKYVRDAFFNPLKFNLSLVGRVRLARKFNLEKPIKFVARDGKIWKKVDEITQFQFASEDITYNGEIIIPRGERIKLKILMEKGIEYIPISVQELSQYIAVEDIGGKKKGEYFDADFYSWAVQNQVEFGGIWYPQALTLLDIVKTLQRLFELRSGLIKGSLLDNLDDIDNLSNRRIRLVGELAEGEFQKGMERVRKFLQSKLAQIPEDEIKKMRIRDFANFKPAISALKEFFAMGQLSQFLDSTNPLSELTHKRRISALGVGGLRRETAGIEVRDVHPSSYGKLCPVETPEGQNIGLISSPTVLARFSPLGFLQTPYRKVENGKVLDEIEYLTAFDEEKVAIAPYDAEDDNGFIKDEYVVARQGTQIRLVRREEIKYIDSAPFQILSPSASLIPFFECDDSNRALMGSNMQRQAVPLLFTEPPLVGTGLEKDIAINTQYVILAKHAGIVKFVSSKRIVIEINDENYPELKGYLDIYNLPKYQRTNQSTCINYRPIVRFGQRVKAGEVIADGPAICKGELSLGKNILVAIMSWRGYTFEDSMVISERLVYDDVFTSVHIEELTVDVRRTKYGVEETTKDIPQVPPQFTQHLDDSGIVLVGTYVNPGDIIVGKITPVGEVAATPEERIIRSIFGKPIENIKDTSLRCPPDVRGVVISVSIHVARGAQKDKRVKEQEKERVKEIEEDKKEVISALRKKLWSGISQIIKNAKLTQPYKIKDKEFSEIDGKFLSEFISRLGELREIESIGKRLSELPVDEETRSKIDYFFEVYKAEEETVRKVYDEKIKETKEGEELPVGVLRRIRVLIASERKIQVGDKLSGRHGNKGVISVILPREDMPFMPDGTPVDIILSPFGIPSRMNVGQLLEMQLGWVSKELGRRIGEIVRGLTDENIRLKKEEIKKRIKEIVLNGEDIRVVRKFCEFIDNMPDDKFVEFVKEAGTIGVLMASLPFDGFKEEDIMYLCDRLGIPRDSKVVLRDGRTGEPFSSPVAVGYMYIQKLVHMVEDKIHTRSTGPYSLITQQPLGGKSRMGGQRLGEMEVWALEAYGASTTLQEMLTVKSDDVIGREKMFDRITKGSPVFQPRIPESFMVLVKELQSLALSVKLLTRRDLEEMKGEVETLEEAAARKIRERKFVEEKKRKRSGR